MRTLPRRTFLKTGALAGLGGGAWLAKFPLVAAEDAALDSRHVRFLPEIEPLVRLIEDTSRDRLLEEVAARIRRGTTYREVLTALMLAGVRNIQPRPVGFKFHAVLVVNSAHLASQHSPDEDRWLPIFWALDQFKRSQARDVEEGDWTMAALDEAALPKADRARAAFIEAMDRWDEPAADVAAAGLVRGAGAQEVFDLFCRFGARDFRDIGHKAIYVANSWRTLQTMGWQHAEPVIRSLAYALLENRSGGNPANNDYEADRPGRLNERRLHEIRPGWQRGKPGPDGGTPALLNTLRTGSWDDASREVVTLLNREVDPGALWDAVFYHAAEMLMRRPGIAALHASTTANALHYSFQHTANDETRRYLLLQAASFMTMFREVSGAGGPGILIEELEPLRLSSEPDAGLAEVFQEISRDKAAAAGKALHYLEATGNARAFMDQARRMVYLRGTDSHDYKYCAAVLEDYGSLRTGMAQRFLAASTYWLKGSAGPDTGLVKRSRAALGG